MFRMKELCFLLCLWCSLGALRCAAQQQTRPPPPDSELRALGQIATKLGIDFWNLTTNPCDGGRGWVEPAPSNDSNAPLRNVACDCNATTCHVVTIQLKSQNLAGVLPAELANLTSLSLIDLTRNVITSTIPREWGSLPLTDIGLLGNRISGQIPDELGNIRTLKSLVLENNLLEGQVPPSLGRLANLTRLFLSANNFTGELPDALGNLTNLEDFRIDGTGISGKFPSFIGNWTKLDRLDMQGTSLEGPFPSTFSSLEKLTELRVTDFNGVGDFPPLEKMKDLKYLFLRNCSISGPLPPYIGSMRKLQYLDLSFNNFTGEIPGSYQSLIGVIDFMFLTNNKLNGSVPDWAFGDASIDLSYNSFMGPEQSNCQRDNTNLVSSFSSSSSNSIASCLRKNLPCSGRATNFNLFINCGGGRVNVNGTDYEADISSVGTARFEAFGNEKWASSSTGQFVGNSNLGYTVNNSSALSMTDPELYLSARVSPLSLKYYGRCLQTGNYTVNLHFAEIVFRDDNTYFSLGRRFFDVSIQGRKVLKDFNIANAANGTGRAFVVPFNATVQDGTLEIHFQWAGKGTNAIPDRGIYGPLISAISVTPNFKPVVDEESTDNKLSTGAIVGIIFASCIAASLIFLLLWLVLRKKDQENEELKGLQLQTGYFSLRQIKAATGNFNPENKIGEGGFGPVYKGVLPDGSLIAVKQLSSKSKQGNREFVNEIGMITALQHPNLVKLYGCCIEGNQLLLIYEYLENNSLARALFGPEGMKLNLDWQTRHKISLDIARGLAYLHEESRLKIVHRDIKATNVLLDKDLNAKISDFGLAKLDDEENTHISTRIAGTVGYMAPEYAMRGYLTDKADVYSFGVVILEIVSGKSNTNYRPKEEFVYLLDWAYVLAEEGRLLELVDPSLGSNYSEVQVEQLLNLALLCTSPSPTLRPQMTQVVMMLEGGTAVKAPARSHVRTASGELRFKSFERLSQDSQGISVDGPWVNSSFTVSNNSSHVSNSTTARPMDASVNSNNGNHVSDSTTSRLIDV